MTGVKSASKTYQELLGPVVLQYLQKLDASIRYLDDGKTVFLFATRAGIRIKKMYEIYLKNFNLPAPANLKLFYVSRFLIAKAHLGTHPEVVRDLFVQEYQNKTVSDLLTTARNRS